MTTGTMRDRLSGRSVAVIAVAAVVVVAVVLVVVRHGSSDDDPDWSAVAAVAPAIPHHPNPTDAQVWAKAGQLDPCALASGSDKPSSSALATSSAECTAYGPAGRVTVDVGIEYSAADLYVRRRFDAGGFAAWSGSGGQTITVDGSGCVVLVPVNAHLAVSFRVDGAHCGLLTSQVRAVMDALASNPHAYDVPEPRPTACQALTWAVRAEHVSGVADHCRSGKGRSSVSVAITTAGVVQGSPVRIAGTPAVQSGPSRRVHACSVEWAMGRASGGGGAGRMNRLVIRVGGGCARARTLAQRVLRRSRAWVPPRPAEPLFYRYDAPDVTGAGACRDLYDQQRRKCAPSVRTSIPDDPVEFLRHGEADPNVVCAAARQALAHGDRSMETVTALDQDPELGDRSRMCVLVNPDHAVEIEIWASRDPLGSQPTGKIAGHAAAHRGAPLPDYAVALGDPSDRGSLHVEARLPTSGPLDEPEWLRGYVEDLVAVTL